MLGVVPWRSGSWRFEQFETATVESSGVLVGRYPRLWMNIAWRFRPKFVLHHWFSLDLDYSLFVVSSPLILPFFFVILPVLTVILLIGHAKLLSCFNDRSPLSLSIAR